MLQFLVFGLKNFLYLFKNKIMYKFYDILGQKKISPSSFGAVVGPGMDKSQDPDPG